MTHQPETLPPEMPELLPCPFCGSQPTFWDGRGTQASLECEECCNACVGVQISDLMEPAERFAPENALDMKTLKYPDWAIERAKNDMIERWNTRAAQPAAKVDVDAVLSFYANIENWKRDKYGACIGFDDDGQLARDCLASTGRIASLGVVPNTNRLAMTVAPEGDVLDASHAELLVAITKIMNISAHMASKRAMELNRIAATAYRNAKDLQS